VKINIRKGGALKIREEPGIKNNFSWPCRPPPVDLPLAGIISQCICGNYTE